jgi:hypothetical protein
MSEIEQLFEEEKKVGEAVRIIGSLILDLSDFTHSRSPEELAQSQILGKKINTECEKIDEEVHKARKLISKLMTEKTSIKLNNENQELHKIENELALIHGDVHIISQLAQEFFKAKNRQAAFDNLSKVYAGLMQHMVALMVEGTGLEV